MKKYTITSICLFVTLLSLGIHYYIPPEAWIYRYIPSEVWGYYDIWVYNFSSLWPVFLIITIASLIIEWTTYNSWIWD